MKHILPEDFKVFSSISNFDLIKFIFNVDEEFAGETSLFLKQEAENRGLCVYVQNSELCIDTGFREP